MAVEMKATQPDTGAKSRLRKFYNAVASIIKFAMHQPLFVGGLIIAPVVIPEAMRSAIIIDGIDVPTTISDDGFSSEIMARRIKDQMREVFARGMPAYSKLGLEDQSVEEKIPDIDLSQNAINIRTAVSLARDFFGFKDNKITGELVVSLTPAPASTQQKKENDTTDEDEPKNYILLLRSTTKGQISKIETRFPDPKFMDLFRNAALAIIENTNPRVAARYYERTTQIDQARRVAANFLKSNDKDGKLDAYYIMANSYFRSHEYENAAEFYKKMLELDSNHLLALGGLANVALWSGRFKECIEYSDRILALNPKPGATPYALKALALASLNRGDEALENAKIGASKGGNNPGLALAAEASAYLRLGRSEEALASANAAINQSPTFHLGYRMRGIANLRLANLDEAIASFRTALEYEPGFWGYWQMLSDALAQKGRTQEAAEAIRNARDRKPERVEIWIKLGERMLLAGKNAQVIPEMQQGLKRFEKNAALVGILAEAYLNIKAPRKAQELLAGFENSRESVIVRRLLMLAKARSDRPKALLYATRLTEVEPKNPQNFYEKYLALRAENKLIAARDALNAAIEAGHANKDQLTKDLASLDQAKGKRATSP
jgi:tetratricopeptide (TPR) repeat protein